MQILNHLAWGEQSGRNQKAVWIGIFVILFVVSILGGFSLGSQRQVTVFYNNRCHVVNSYCNSPADILAKAGISLGGNQEYEMEHTTEGAVLRVGPQFTVSVLADGVQHCLVTRTDRVENLLNQLGIAVGQNDVVTPGRQAIVTDDCTITVQRVTYATAVREEPVEPHVMYVDSPQLPKGTLAVKEPGLCGTAQVTYQDKLVDGELAGSSILSSVVVSEPKTKVMYRGTASPDRFAPVVTTSNQINEKMVSQLQPNTPIAVDEKGQPLAYKKCITGKATAYTAADGKHTSTGVEAQVGYIAVDPNEIPYGTMMYIKTADGSYFYGLAKAADTGGFVSGDVAVDLFFETEQECIQFGVRDVEIYVL